MVLGKSVSLRVRPFVSVDLSFPVAGLISKQSETLLGTTVEGADIGILHGMLGQPSAGQESRLLWDSEQILAYLFGVPTEAGPGSLGTIVSRLRSTVEAADLDRAILMRQNAYLTTYSPSLLSEVRRVYHDDPGDGAAVRHRLLRAVETDIEVMHRGLKTAYERRGWWGKVIEFARGVSDNKATQYSGSGHIQFEGFTDTESWGYEFRYPSAENELRYHQSKAAVRQEFLAAWRMSEMCRNGDVTFPNEMGAIDRSVRALQSAYIDTFLVPPHSGVVTAVFHGAGEYVQAGEPVVRVEDDTFVYLVGTVKHRGTLRVGDQLTVGTTLFEAAGAAPVSVTGEVVAVRGHDSVSEQWDLLVFCPNYLEEAPGTRVLPLNYHFDFESTTVERVVV